MSTLNPFRSLTKLYEAGIIKKALKIFPFSRKSEIKSRIGTMRIPMTNKNGQIKKRGSHKEKLLSPLILRLTIDGGSFICLTPLKRHQLKFLRFPIYQVTHFCLEVDW